MTTACIVSELLQRRDDIRAWLLEEAPETATGQAHLDPSSDAAAYWHHGYQSALDDLIALFRDPPASHTSGNANH